jgi:hypothetical protein
MHADAAPTRTVVQMQRAGGQRSCSKEAAREGRAEAQEHDHAASLVGQPVAVHACCPHHTTAWWGPREYTQTPLFECQARHAVTPRMQTLHLQQMPITANQVVWVHGMMSVAHWDGWVRSQTRNAVGGGCVGRR